MTDQDKDLLATTAQRTFDIWQIKNEMRLRVLGISVIKTEMRLSHRLNLLSDTGRCNRAQLLLRLFTSLENLLGNDSVSGRAWLATYNSDLEAKPVDLLVSYNGIDKVCEYVDSYRTRC